MTTWLGGYESLERIIAELIESTGDSPSEVRSTVSFNICTKAGRNSGHPEKELGSLGAAVISYGPPRCGEPSSA
jgi:hypothetical protein